MNTFQLECFLTVAEHLNFSKSAELLGITQPAVSHQIAALEEELDVSLFMRTSKKVELTNAGIQLIGDAKKIVIIAGNAKKRLSESGQYSPLLYTIGCHDQFELRLFPPLLKKAVEKYPNLHPVIKFLPFSSLANLLENNSIQLLFDWKNERKHYTSTLFHEIKKCPPACVCAPFHPLAKKSSVTAADLTGPYILYEAHTSSNAVYQMQNRFLENHPASEIYFADSYEALTALAAAGLGIALLPDIPMLREPSLCYLPFEDAAPLTFGAYYKKQNHYKLTKELFLILEEMQL